MVAASTKYAHLKKDQINKLQELEKELGKVVIAYEPEPTFARLSEEQLKRVQEVEQELGLILVAYKK